MTVLLIVLAGFASYTVLCAVSWPFRRRILRQRDRELVVLVLANAPRTYRQLMLATGIGDFRLARALDDARGCGLVTAQFDLHSVRHYRLAVGL